jgi:hypothetical protein
MSENKFNTITVLDYCLNQVRVYRNVQTDDAEAWLEEHDLNWSEDQCYYMYGEDTEVIDEEGV